MRSQDERLTVTLKPRKKKSSSEDKSNQSLASTAVGSRWSTISCKKWHGEQSNDGMVSTVIDANNSNDIVELFCESSDDSNEERTTCSQVSSSTELEEDEMCATCKDCVECQLEQQDSAAKIRKTKGGLMSEQDEEHLNYEGDVSSVETTSTSSTTALMEHGEAPIFVDLTSEESKQVWKQTILRRFSDVEESLEMSGENVITSKSGVSYLSNIIDL